MRDFIGCTDQVKAGPNRSRLDAAASTNATLLRDAPANLYGWYLENNAAYDAFVKFYDKAGVPVPAALAAILTAANAYVSIDLSANADNRFNFDVTDGTTLTHVSLAPVDGTSSVISLAQAVTAINTALTGGGTNVTASSASGKLVFTTSATGSGATVTVSNVTVTGTTPVAVASNLGISPTTTGQTATGTAADVPAFTVKVKAGLAEEKDWPFGIPFTVGLAYVATKLYADTDTTVLVAHDVQGVLLWK